MYGTARGAPYATHHRFEQLCDVEEQGNLEICERNTPEEISRHKNVHRCLSNEVLLLNHLKTTNNMVT